MSFLAAFFEKRQRQSGANPGPLKRLHAHFSHPQRCEQTQFEALCSGRFQFDGNELELRPIGRQFGVQFLERPTRFGRAPLQRDPLRFRQCGRREKRYQSTCDDRFHGASAYFK